MSCKPAGFPNKDSSKNPETGRHELGMLQAVFKLDLASHGKGEGQGREAGRISALDGFC